MIVVRLQGGLGNQFFQYAMGKAFEYRNKVRVKYDFSYFRLTQKKEYLIYRPYELDHFMTSLYHSNKIHEIFFRASNKIGLPFGKVYNEKVNNLFNTPKFLNLRSGYFNGYWQSIKYFEDFNSEILKELRLSKPLDLVNRRWQEKMENCNSISLHIRRGDYLHHSVRGFLKNPIDYYNKAIAHICKNVEHPCFFAFSDDLEWTKKNIEIENEIHYMNINRGRDSYKDLVLMSSCTHNVIANSTFSWWGAYLNRNKDKIVVAPKDWGFSMSKGITIPNWILIE